MGRLLLESGIVVLLVLIGISVFIPEDGSSVSDVIVEFEGSVESGEVIEDGEIENVEVTVEDESTFVAKLNCKIANTIVNGLNSIFDIGLRTLRQLINWGLQLSKLWLQAFIHYDNIYG